MKLGDKYQYNKIYKPEEVVTILNVDKTHTLVQFPSGYKLCTIQSGLWPLKETEEKGQLELML